MEIYLLIGAVYAIFNYDRNTGIYGFLRDVVLWPFDILKNLVVGWNKAKSKDHLIRNTNIKLCHKSMEEFHDTLADTILGATGQELAAQPEHIRTGFIIYEIQAALAAAQKFRIDQQHHHDFAVTTLTRGHIPQGQAAGMVNSVLQSTSGVQGWANQAIDGAAGYEQLTLGSDSLVQHIKATLARLQSMPQKQI